MSAVLTFLGGSAFRMLWGEISAAWTKRQDHKHEIERMRLQAEHDQAQHDRTVQMVKIQAEQQVKVIEVAAQGEVDKTMAEAFNNAVRATMVTTGLAWVDAWNAVIRPFGATWALGMLTAHEFGWLAAPLSTSTQDVCYAFLGIFVADRALGRRGR